MTVPYATDVGILGYTTAWPDPPPGVNQKSWPRIGRFGALVADAGLPPLGELAIAGKLFVLSPGVVANAVAPVQDSPGTASAYTLVNNNPAGSNIFLLPVKAFARVASGTEGLGASLTIGFPNTPQSGAVVNTTGVLGPFNNRGDSPYGSKATLATGVTLAASPAWFDIAGRDEPSAVEIGAALVADLWGCGAVAPGFYGMGMHIIAPAGTTAKFSIGVMYAEVHAAF